MFTGKPVPFKIAINEWYISHPISAKVGTDHSMAFEIYGKIAEEEIKHLETKNSELKPMDVREIGKIMTEDSKAFRFSYECIAYSCKKLKLEESFKVRSGEIIGKALASIEDVMTKSKIVDFVKLTDEVKGHEGKPILTKDFSFSAMFRLMESQGMSGLLESVNLSPKFLSTFTSFAKQQVGGPREILIMWVRSRLMIKILEFMSKVYCHNNLPEEMLTDSYKELTFTQMSRRMKAHMVGMESPSFLSLNLDTTRWSQRWASTKSLMVIFSMGLPTNIEEILILVVKAWSFKILFLNKIVLEQLVSLAFPEKKSKVMSDVVKLFNKKDKHLVVRSGFFQGLMHYMSSISAVAKSRLAIEIFETNCSRLKVANVNHLEMMSSDDLTAVCCFESKCSAHYKKMAVLLLMSYFAAGNLFCEHVSTKKTSCHSAIFEFNSMFSLSGKVVTLSIKHASSMYHFPDFSNPLPSLKSFVSDAGR